MTKGLDATFTKFGIRKPDMELLQALAEKHGLDFDPIEDLLGNLHQARMDNENLEEKALMALIRKALPRPAKEAH